MKNTLLPFILSVLFFACNNSKYSECNEIMGVCSNSNEPYCLFGFDFANNGKSEADKHAVLISYSIQPEGEKVSTHAEDSLLSLSFSHLIPCSQEAIRKALNAYEGVSNIEFVEKHYETDTDIKFSVADMGDKRGAVAFPNFESDPCAQISGSIIINSKVTGHTCKSFYLSMLHEIGHALGLGHVNSDNIMNPATYMKHSKLQRWDSLGIVELYGKKAVRSNTL